MSGKLYQRIYLSPHLDDVALSCGGCIHQERQRGQSVLVLTIMAGDPTPEAMNTPYVMGLHTRWDLNTHPNPVAARRAEDREALSILDVAGLYWEWPDCIYRYHPQNGDFLYHSGEALFGPVHPVEKTLVGEIAQRLAELPLAPGGRVYMPLAVGKHVDHCLVRQAAEKWGAPRGVLIYYEDYPYAERTEALTVMLNDGREWQAEVVSLDEPALAAKTDAIACYRSQISTFFTGEDEMASRIRAYAASAGGGKGWAERYWRRGIRSAS